jgi:hypothetical protein
MTVSLRTRLTLFFVAIVVLPVTAVTILGWRAVARSSDRQVRSELEHSRRSAMLVFAGQVEQAADVVVRSQATRRCSGPWRPATGPGCKPSSSAGTRPSCWSR